MLAIAVVVGLLSVLPKIPHDQTLRIDLGDSSKITHALTLRWAPISNEKKTEVAVEDWTGEVTFRYEKNQAPRIIEHRVHVTDGDYEVEIEVSTDRGGAVTRKNVALAGGTTTIDFSSVSPEPTAPDHDPSFMKDGGAK